MRSLTPEHRWKDRYQGDHLFIGFSDADMEREAATRHDVYAKLAADPGMIEAFARAGLPPMRHWAGSVMSKPPKGPPLYWHHVRLRPPLPLHAPAGQPPSRLGHPAPTMSTRAGLGVLRPPAVVEAARHADLCHGLPHPDHPGERR